MTLRSALVALLALLPLACTAQNATAPNSAPAPNTTSQGSPAAPATSAPVAGEAPAAAAGPKVTYNSCNVDGPYIAMTFDDGPHATFTPRLLDMLKERKLKATFFVVGQNALEYPQIMKRIVEEGH
jgi:peptidoglycan/xylan/chitin deacetylase (PgdA/CDA1 family)